MCGLKCWIRVVVIALIIQSGHLISTGTRNGTAEILWRLSQLAIQGRQKYPSQFQLHPEQFSKYTGPIKANSVSREQYGLLQNPRQHPTYQRPYADFQQPNPGFQRPYPDFQKPHLDFQRPYLDFQRPHSDFQRPRPDFQRPYPEFQRPHPDFQRPNPDFQLPYPGQRPGFPKPIPALPPGYQEYQQNFGLSPQSFMGALQSIAQNDDLHCVPRLLCELTSGPSSGSSSGQKQTSFLPFNLDTESFIGLLSAITGPQTSPILEFGKAALLGYTSKDKTRSCLYAYPRCPQEPDRLVEYLNNHNGGFFRFFNGIPPYGYPQNPQHQFFPNQYPQNYPFQQTQNPQRPFFPQLLPQNPQNYPSYRPQPYPHQYQQHPQNYDFYQQKKVYAEKRIQTQPVEYLGVTFKPGVRFPNGLEDEMSNEVLPQQESLVFPEQVNINGYEQQVREQKGRRQKAVAFPATGFDFLKPNLKQVPMIFPDRTGTGELRLDAEELGIYNYENPYFPNSKEYYRKFNGINPYFEDHRNLFRFPLPK